MNKKAITSLLLACMLTMSVGCTGGGSNSSGNDDSGNTDTEIEIAYQAASENLYAATINSIVATDALGRSFGEGNVADSEKDVGMFYFVWQGEHIGNTIYNVEELKKNSSDKLWSMGEDGTPAGSYYYWGEPLYGYYRSDDPWVVMRHIELFTMSGIDYLALDLTNISLYEKNCTVLFDCLAELQSQGWDVPKVMEFLNGTDYSIDHAARIEQFYETFYANKKYENIWYRSKEDNKPIIAIDIGVYYEKLKPELKDFFHFRNTIWPQAESGTGVFEDISWLDYVYPQRLYETTNGGIMNVSVAQHVSGSFGLSANPATREKYYNANRGRGYDYTKNTNSEDNILSGTNLETQWENALNSVNCDEVFVTGWNEWIMEKRGQNQLPMYLDISDVISDKSKLASFCDNCDYEFSRDLEMMKGGYGDNYYLQNARNTKKFKSLKDYVYFGATSTQDLNESIWSNVRTYLDFSGDAMARDAYNANNSEKYTNNTNRNDIVKTEVCNDSEYLYIRITTKDDIQVEKGKENNLNVLFSVGGASGAKWNGYSYVLNRELSTLNQKATRLQRIQENGKYTFENVAFCDMAISGKTFSARIPLSYLGISDTDNFTIDFKVADGIGDPSDIMNYYIDGDCAPIGRLNYRYNSLTKKLG